MVAIKETTKADRRTRTVIIIYIADKCIDSE